MKVYPDVKLEFSRFENGCYIVDKHENKYIDLHSGAGSFFFGYPKISESDLASGEIFGSTNFFQHFHTEALVKRLEDISGYKCPIFLCSGSEANEAAIKLALRYFKGKRRKIGFVPGCYFGRSYLACMCSGNTNYTDFLGDDDRFVRINKKEDLNETFACLILEHLPSVSLEWDSRFIEELAVEAQSHGIVVICDEVKAGFRTGNLFSFIGKFLPDIVTVSKSLASGFPVSTVLVNEKLFELCDANWYTNTHGGFPFGCKIALDNLENIRQIPTSIDFMEKHKKRLEVLFGNRLRMLGKYISVKDIDGRALGTFLKDSGYLVYERSDFVSFFPNLSFDDNMFSDFLGVLESEKNGLHRFFRG